MNEVEFAKFPDEFNVAKHLDLGDGPLLLLFRSKRVVVFVVDCGQTSAVLAAEEQPEAATKTYFQHFWCGFQIHPEVWKSAIF